jgi:hypothetical protein
MAAMFGILGSLLSESATSTFEMKIDQHNGRFIPIREIAKYSKE